MANRYQEHSSSTLEDQQRQIDRIEHQLDEYREEIARAAVSFKQEIDTAAHIVDYKDVFEKQVNSTKVSKWIWQITTIILLILLFFLTVGFISGIQEEGIDTTSFGTDLLILGVPILIAMFTMRQTRKASQDEKDLRKQIIKLSIGEQDTSSDRRADRW